MMEKRRIVTKDSDDGTFQIGDHIIFKEDGSICCTEAQGWINKEDVAEASLGMESILDIKWIEKKREKLLKELKLVNEYKKL